MKHQCHTPLGPPPKDFSLRSTPDGLLQRDLTRKRACRTERQGIGGSLANDTSRKHPSPNEVNSGIMLVVSHRRCCEMLSIGLTRCYELMNAGELDSFKDGKARKITIASIKAYIDRRLAASS